jgi:hypothetical protein
MKKPTKHKHDEPKVQANLPALWPNDGFALPALTDSVIVGTRIKFVDKWTADGLELPAGNKYLAFGTDKILQRFHDDGVDTIREKPLPNPDDLNSQIPQSEWQPDLNGNPRPPWQYGYIVYLLDEATAEKFTFINSTIGARIAVHALQDRVASMRILRWVNVIAEVELASRPMKTRFGLKSRPHFHIVGWRQLGGAGQPQLLTKVSEPTTAEELNHEIPF